MDETKLRDAAARETRRRIRADRDRVSERLRPFLDTIAKRFCDTDFNVAALWRKHKVRDKGAHEFFSELGIGPGKYISNARMEVAAYLLRKTHLRLWRVANLVVVSRRTLLRRFRDRYHQTPDQYRRDGGSDLADETPQAFGEKVFQGLEGGLSQPDGEELTETVRGVWEKLSFVYSVPVPEPPPTALSGGELEQFQAERKLWPYLAGEELSFEAKRRFARSCQGLVTPAFYELLHRKSREEGRKVRQRGIELAQLALDSLDASADTLGPHYFVLRPQAWAWLGNTHRLALDFLAADRAIEEAVRTLEATGDPFAAGIVYLCKGTLRTFQRRHDEAVELFDVALPAFEAAGDGTWQIMTLAHRAASLDYAGKHDLSLATLTKATALPGAGAKPFAFELPFSAVAALVNLDRFAEAEQYLESLRSDQGLDTSGWRYLWVEARVDQGLARLNEAEEKYLSTVQVLEEPDEPSYRSLVLLDLAVMYADQGNTVKVGHICETIYPFFESLRMYDETVAAVQLLGSAISKTSVTPDVLRNLRASLLRDPLIELKRL